MLEAITKRHKNLKRCEKGISNVLVVLLSLILVTVIVANVVLWGYQMNQLDWEKTQEKTEITYAGVNSPWFTSKTEYLLERGNRISGTYEDTRYAEDNAYEIFIEEPFSQNTFTYSWPSNYALLGSTRQESGSLIDLQRNDDSYMVLESYASESIISTFGNTNAGVSYTAIAANRMYGSLFTSPSAYVIAKSITFYGRSVSGTRNVKCLIVRHSDMHIIAITDPIPITTTLQWWTANFSSSPTLFPNTEYILMIIPDNSIRFYYTTGFADQGHYDNSNSYDSPSDPADSQHNSYQYSIYCTYEQASEHKVEVEFRGSVEINSCTQIIWSIDSGSTSDLVNAIFQLYDYQANRYSEVGEEGYTSTLLGTSDSLLTNTVTSNPSRYFDSTTGEWKLKVACVKYSSTPFNWRADLVELRLVTQISSDFVLCITGEFFLNMVKFSPHVRLLEIVLRAKSSDDVEKWALKAYNWVSGQYEEISQLNTATSFRYCTIPLLNWQNFVNDNGIIMLAVYDASPDANQTTIYIDFFGVRLVFNGSIFIIKNFGASTVHVVSIWVINATHHVRYEENLFVNSGETVAHLREDIFLPSNSFVAKLVTFKGNIAVFISD